MKSHYQPDWILYTTFGNTWISNSTFLQAAPYVANVLTFFILLDPLMNQKLDALFSNKL